jgi:hypothetical protein
VTATAYDLFRALATKAPELDIAAMALEIEDHNRPHRIGEEPGRP